jgi:hypothetical protein
MNNSRGKYFIKRASGDTYTDITTMFDGVAVLSLDGMGGVGDSLNVFTQQWVESQTEDFKITKQESGSDVIIRKNVDITLTFAVGRRYTNKLISERLVYDAFVDYVTNGDFYIKSVYANKEAHVICLKGFKPTAVKLNRGWGSYIMATIELHTLDNPNTVDSTPVTQDLYIGFGDSMMWTSDKIINLQNVQHHTSQSDFGGDYSITNTNTKYLWICSTRKLDPSQVLSDIFYIPINVEIRIDDFYCYRSSKRIIPTTVDFTLIDSN